MTHIYELGALDVGSSRIRANDGTLVHLINVMGRVLPRDVGKRLYRVDGVVQVENDQQLAARLERS